MNPVGLTRAEEAHEQPAAAPAPAVKATAGQPGCRITTPPDGDACGALAERRIVWPDGDETVACLACAVRMAQLAAAHKTVIRVLPLPPPLPPRAGPPKGVE